VLNAVNGVAVGDAEGIHGAGVGRAHVVNTGVHDTALDDRPRGALKGEKRLMAETRQVAGREGSEESEKVQRHLRRA
jgi:hypothetical protein